MVDWYDIKECVEQYTGLSMDALHVHAGVLGQILVAMILRRSIASPWPWLAVLGAVLANERFDLRYEIWPDRDAQYEESFRDVWNTMLLPTALLLLARFRLALFGLPVAPAREED